MNNNLLRLSALLVMGAAGPALALGEYNGAIEQACTGHSVEMTIPRDIIDNEKTIAMHPDPQLGRRLVFESNQRWICQMHKGDMLFGSTSDGWGGSYRILPELNDDGVIIMLSPTTSPSPNN